MNPFCKQARSTLTGKLVLLFITIAIAVVITIGSIIAWSFRNHFEESIRPHLMQYIGYIQSDIGSPPDPIKAKHLADTLSLEIHYLSDEKQWSTNDNPIQLQHVHFYSELKQGGVDYGFGHYFDREYLVSRHQGYTLAFSIPHKSKTIANKIVPVIAILVMLILLYWAIKRLFCPIDDLKAGIQRIGDGELDHRIHINRCDELGELASSINAMADDIEQMLEAKRQLLLAISHELRSPLTRAKVALEFIDDEKQRSDIRQDLDEMEKLIEELLETERLNTRHSKLNKTSTHLQTLIHEVMDSYFPHNGFTLNLPDEIIMIEADQARLKLLLKNILDNAMHHNPSDAQPPSLTINKHRQGVEITICDHGQGIEAQHIPHLTEAFYRTDKARQRQTGGYGLGLYLCKVIVDAHQGQFTIESELGSGTCVTIQLPYSAED